MKVDIAAIRADVCDEAECDAETCSTIRLLCDRVEELENVIRHVLVCHKGTQSTTSKILRNALEGGE